MLAFLIWYQTYYWVVAIMNKNFLRTSFRRYARYHISLVFKIWSRLGGAKFGRIVYRFHIKADRSCLNFTRWPRARLVRTKRTRKVYAQMCCTSGTNIGSHTVWNFNYSIWMWMSICRNYYLRGFIEVIFELWKCIMFYFDLYCINTKLILELFANCDYLYTTEILCVFP